MTNFDFRIEIGRAAFERRHDDPKRDFGVGAVKLHFFLIGELGAVELEVHTGWYLPHVAERFRREQPHQRNRYSGGWHKCVFEGEPGPVWFHSRRPLHDDHEPPQECRLLDADCYSDVWYSGGDELWKKLLEGGEDGLRAAMESYYDEHIAQRVGA